MGLFSFLGDEHEVDPKSAEIPGYDAWQNQMRGGAQAAGTRAGATMGAAQLDGGAQGDMRGRQVALADALAAQAAGQGPSLAQDQLRRAQSNSLAQALALQNSARGAQRAGALRTTAYAQGAINAQAGADSASLALNEQLQARNALGQVLAGARGQDIAYAGENARMQQEANAQNLQAEVQQRSLNDNLVRFYVSQGMSLAMAQQQARAQLEQQRLQAHEGAAGRGIGVAQGLANGAASGIGAGIDAIIPGL